MSDYNLNLSENEKGKFQYFKAHEQLFKVKIVNNFYFIFFKKLNWAN